MNVKWEPAWYELDQSIVVGDIDLFYLSKDTLCFFKRFLGNNECEDYEVKAEILTIKHPELGDIRGIIAIGLSYSIYLSDGNEIIVNAEESPGSIENEKYIVKRWDFDVEIKIIEKTGLSWKDRLKMLTYQERKIHYQESIKRYKALLGLTKVDWER